MERPRSDDPPNPDGSSGWEALPPDGEPPAEDAADDTEASTDDEPGRSSSSRS